MNIHRILFILIFYISSFCASYAQTVIWQFPLDNDYSSLSLMGNGLYQATKGNYVGVIKADGTIVVPIEATDINGFYEEMALVIRKESSQKRILGHLTPNGNYTEFRKTYYVIEGMDFFSEGLLPVINEKKRLGYINTMGQEVLGFDGKYDEIHPFTEGRAAVFVDDEFCLIDTHGNEATILTGAEIGAGTNLYNGVSYIADAYDDYYYAWNKNQGSSVCKKIKAPRTTNLDYLFCFSDITGRPAKTPFKTLTPGVPELEPSVENGKYGYKSADNPILPCQLDEASPVYGGLAVVKMNGHYGILKILPHSETFSATSPADPFEYIAGHSVKCHFFMTVPQEWHDTPLDITATNAKTGERIELTNNSTNKYSFSHTPKEDLAQYSISVKSGSLELWKGNTEMRFKKKQVELRTSIEIAGLQSNMARANADDRVIVRAIITNPGEETVSALVKMSGSESFQSKTERISVPAHGKTIVESYFVVKENLENQFVQVTTDNGAGTTQYSLRLKTVDDIE